MYLKTILEYFNHFLLLVFFRQPNKIHILLITHEYLILFLNRFSLLSFIIASSLLIFSTLFDIYLKFIDVI